VPTNCGRRTCFRYREVLNRHHDVETAEAHVEASGLVGIIGACSPKFAEQLVCVDVARTRACCFLSLFFYPLDLSCLSTCPALPSAALGEPWGR